MSEQKIKAYFNTKEDKLLSPKDFKRVRVGVYGVCMRGDEVLTVRIVPDPKNNPDKICFLAPLWDVPGGGIEPGETVEAALDREFFEETGARIKTKKLWHVGQAFYCNAKFAMVNVQVYYLVGLENESFRADNRNSLEVKWNKIDKLSRENSLPGLYQVVDKAKGELI